MKDETIYSIDAARVTKELTQAEIDVCRPLALKLRGAHPHLTDQDIASVLMSAATLVSILDDHEPGVKLLISVAHGILATERQGRA